MIRGRLLRSSTADQSVHVIVQFTNNCVSDRIVSLTGGPKEFLDECLFLDYSSHTAPQSNRTTPAPLRRRSRAVVVVSPRTAEPAGGGRPGALGPVSTHVLQMTPQALQRTTWTAGLGRARRALPSLCGTVRFLSNMAGPNFRLARGNSKRKRENISETTNSCSQAASPSVSYSNKRTLKLRL